MWWGFKDVLWSFKWILNHKINGIYIFHHIFVLPIRWVTKHSIHQPPSNPISRPFKAKPVEPFAYCWFCHPSLAVGWFRFRENSLWIKTIKKMCVEKTSKLLMKCKVRGQGLVIVMSGHLVTQTATSVLPTTHHASLWSDVRRLLDPGLMPTQREWDTRATRVASSQPARPAAQLSQETHKLVSAATILIFCLNLILYCFDSSSSTLQDHTTRTPSP